MLTRGLIFLPAAVIIAITALCLEAATELGPLEKWDSKLSTLLCVEALLEEALGGCSVKVFLIISH